MIGSFLILKYKELRHEERSKSESKLPTKTALRPARPLSVRKERRLPPTRWKTFINKNLAPPPKGETRLWRPTEVGL